MFDYWKDCIAEAFEDAGITATVEQIDTVASWVEGSHENYSMAHGHDCIPNPLREENERLAKELKQECSKRWCPECRGKGYIIENYGFRSSQSSCGNCNGTGKID